MRTTKAYVAQYPSGQFVAISEQQTHTGNHVYVGRVEDIDDATLFSIPRFSRAQKNYISEAEVEFVKVEKKHEVIKMEWAS